MTKKIIFLILISLVIINGCEKKIENNSNCINITYLDGDMKLDSVQAPKGTWEEKACPSGKKVIYIDLIKTEDISIWRKALYCEDENYFWIADMNNARLINKLQWYGVYEGRPCALP